MNEGINEGHVGSFKFHGFIVMVNEQGLSYLPANFRKEFELKKGGRIGFFLDGSIALLMKEEANLKEALEGLEVMKSIMKLHWKEKRPLQAVAQ